MYTKSLGSQGDAKVTWELTRCLTSNKVAMGNSSTLGLSDLSIRKNFDFI